MSLFVLHTRGEISPPSEIHRAHSVNKWVQQGAEIDYKCSSHLKLESMENSSDYEIHLSERFRKAGLLNLFKAY